MRIWIPNKRGHMDPFCITSMIFVIAAGALTMRAIMEGANPGFLLWIFPVFVIIAQLVFFVHHGMTPVGGPISFVNLLTSVFIIRYVIGSFPIIGGYLHLIIPLIMLLEIIKTFTF